MLRSYKAGETSEDTVIAALKKLPFEDLGFSKVDHHRALRCGFPEVIFCEGKLPPQISQIAERILSYSGAGLIATRADAAAATAIQNIAANAVYHEVARVVTVPGAKLKGGRICLVSAGTADIPVAEEAAVVAEALGHTVERVYDVGVAGIHRLLAQVERINSAQVVITVAGMEGALASVVGGLTDLPVIAVPTSVGYGASFGGVSALLTMLNSCSAGIGVCNIDNGFGAAWLANNIIRSCKCIND
ncbi:MAG: nickel pincer cofactor biosynthesis protein LarB [Clostridia bacterium]